MLKNIRIAAGMMAAVMFTGIIAGCGKSGEKEYMKTADESVTIEQAADYLTHAADDYNKDVDKKIILEGLKNQEKATRLEALAMVSRAFGKLPEPQGNNKKIAPGETDLSIIPDWAQEDFQNLNRGGVLADSDLGLSEETKSNSDEGIMLEDTASLETNKTDETAVQPDMEGTDGKKDYLSEKISLKGIEMYCKRIYALYGNNLKDDFYANVNKEDLENMSIPEGDTKAGGSSTVEAETNKKVNELIKKIVDSPEQYESGSREQKIRDFYESIMAPRTEGIKPLEAWFQKISSAENLDELRNIQIEIIKQLGLTNNGLLPVSISGDMDNPEKKVLNLSSGFSALTLEDYENPDSSAYKEYRSSTVDMLMECQETKESAEELADAILTLEKEQLKNGMTEEEAGDLSNYNNTFSMEELNDMVPELGAREFLTGIGFDASLRVQIYDIKAFKVLASHTTNEELSRIKAQIKLSLLQNNRSLLTGSSTEEEACEEVANYLSTELGQIYVEQYFPAEAKAGMEKMTSQMIEVFKKRISHLDWMEENTKKEALRKLDTLTVLIGYPDEWPESKIVIKSLQERGSYYSNMAAIEQERLRTDIENQFGTEKVFDLSAYMVNASANRQTNTLMFPAGILQAPFYDVSASLEKNLGGIGVIIAHEITHIFDDEGAQYDADGKIRNWWSTKDYTHFKEQCQKAVKAYDGEEAVAGITINGESTLSENIADTGGVACALDILSAKKNADYDAFFRNYAKSWLLVTDRDTIAELAASDEHAPKKLRVNKVLSNFQKFFDTYDISEGDGMYTALEDRISIW